MRGGGSWCIKKVSLSFHTLGRRGLGSSGAGAGGGMLEASFDGLFHRHSQSGYHVPAAQVFSSVNQQLTKQATVSRLPNPTHARQEISSASECG